MRIRSRAATAAFLIAIVAAPAVAVPAAAGETATAPSVEPAGAIISASAWAVVMSPEVDEYMPEAAYAHAPGGTTTVDRTGDGNWTITWTATIADTLPNRGNVHVSPLGSTAHQCWVRSWNASTSKIEAKVRCRNAADASTDTPFVVMWLMHESPYTADTGMRSGYAWMNVEGGSGTPNTGYQATTSGETITSTRTEKGHYIVSMPGLERAEHVVVTSWNTDVSCRAEGWTAGAAGLDVNVVCRQMDGDPDDERFTIFAGRNVSVGAPANVWSAYAVVRKPQRTRYQLADQNAFNNADEPVRVRRLTEGHWSLHFPGMSPGGAAIVSPLGGDATCQVARLPQTTKFLRIGVRCFAPDGTPADNRFVVSWGR